MAAKKPDVVVEDGAVYVLRSGTPLYVKTADICAATGYSNQWIGQLVSQGTICKRTTPHGAMFEMTATMRDICNMLDAKAKAKSEKSEEDLKQEKALNSANVTMKVSKAAIAKLEAEELQGKMHRSEDVAAMTEDLIYAIRGALIALPGRLAVDVAAVKTPAEAAEIIRKEVYKVMRELANYQYDPGKYEERVRNRLSWDKAECDDDDG